MFGMASEALAHCGAVVTVDTCLISHDLPGDHAVLRGLRFSAYIRALSLSFAHPRR